VIVVTSSLAGIGLRVTIAAAYTLKVCPQQARTHPLRLARAARSSAIIRRI
jgi:hypothetical protein